MDLAALGAFDRQLAANMAGEGTLVSGVPANLERIAEERRLALTGLTMGLA